MPIKIKDFEFYFILLSFVFCSHLILWNYRILWLLYFKKNFELVRENDQSEKLYVSIFENRENLVVYLILKQNFRSIYENGQRSKRIIFS